MIYVIKNPVGNIYHHKLTHYRSFVWSEKMSEAGEFEIVYTGDDDKLDDIHIGDCIGPDLSYSHAYGYVESVSSETDENGTKTKKYVGRTAEVILDKCSAMTIRPTKYSWLRRVEGTDIGTDKGTGPIAGAAKYHLVNGRWERYGRIAGCVNPNFEHGLATYGYDSSNVSVEWKVDNDGTSYAQCKWNGSSGWGWFGTSLAYNDGLPTNTRIGSKYHVVFDINIPRERYGPYAHANHCINRVIVVVRNSSGQNSYIFGPYYPNTTGDLRVEADMTIPSGYSAVGFAVGVAGTDEKEDKDYIVNVKHANWYLIDYGSGGSTNPPQLPDNDPVYYYDGNSKYFDIFKTRKVGDSIKPIDAAMSLLKWAVNHDEDNDKSSALKGKYNVLDFDSTMTIDRSYNGGFNVNNATARYYREKTEIDYEVGAKSVYEYMKELCSNYKLSFNLLRVLDSVQFTLTDGSDRTLDSAYPVVFSPQLKNFVNGSWVDTRKDYATLAAVYGDGEFVLVDMYGSEYGDVSTVGNPESDPILVVDAGSDVKKDDYDNIDAYRKALMNLGADKLRSESNNRWSTESEISKNNVVYKYEKDFYLGSVVTVIDDEGIRRDMQVTEYTFTMDEAGFRQWPTLTDHKEYAPNTWSSQGTTVWQDASGDWHSN